MFIQRSLELNQEFECLSPDIKLKMMRLYNFHFSGSNCWFFTDKLFQQLINSYNVNVRIIFQVPRNTHCWITEELCGGRHAKQQIYRRYVKFVNSLANTERQNIKSLFNFVSSDVRSQAGTNLRKILMDSNILVLPGTTRPGSFSQYTVYPTPVGDEYKVPLILSLLSILEDNWEVLFNEEDDDEDSLEENDLQFMINELCST